jgi:hypothetical protein
MSKVETWAYSQGKTGVFLPSARVKETRITPRRKSGRAGDWGLGIGKLGD